MTNLYTLTILIATIFMISCNDSDDFELKKSTDILDGWEISKITYDNPLIFADMFFVNSEVGFVVGNNEKANNIEALFYKTIDSGKSWKKQALMGPTTFADSVHVLGSVYFHNEQIGFIGGRKRRGGGLLLKTHDGGDTWNEIFFREDWVIKPLYFWDEFRGLAWIGVPKTLVPFGNVFAKTSDGGYTWEFLDLAIRERGRNFYSIADDVVFVVGENQKILKVTDFGNSWETITTPILEGIVGNIHFTNEKTGFIEGYTSMYKTIDGGLNWQTIDFPASISPYFGLFHCYDETEGFFIENIFHQDGSDMPLVVGNIGYQTKDGWETWSESEKVKPLGILITQFPNRELGYGYNPNSREFYTIKKK